MGDEVFEIKFFEETPEFEIKLFDELSGSGSTNLLKLPITEVASPDLKLVITQTELVNNVPTEVACRITPQNANLQTTLPQAYIDYLEEQTYQSPIVSVFNITGLGGEVEIGTSVIVNELVHMETNIENIEGALTLLYDGQIVSSDITPIDASAAINFPFISVTRNSAGSRSFVLRGVDSRENVFSKTVTKNFYIPKFTGTSPNASLTSTDILNLIRSKNLQTTVSLSSVQYIYFVTDGYINNIKDADTGFGVPLENYINTNVNINGIEVTYHVYRTSNRIVSGTYHFIIS